MRHGHVHAHHHVQGGAPVIDIGDDIGALVVFMDDVEPASTVHTGVWTRQHRGGHVTAAVFGELAEGSYWVLDAVGSDRFLVQIRGGELAQIDVRTGARTPA